MCVWEGGGGVPAVTLLSQRGLALNTDLGRSYQLDDLELKIILRYNKITYCYGLNVPPSQILMLKS